MPEEKDQKIVNQSNSNAGGDIVAGDKIENHFHGTKKPLKELADQISVLYIENATFGQFIDQLQHYVNRKDNTHKGLDEKLTEANFSENILQATEMKERFTKKLMANQFSEQVQNLFSQILSHIYVTFTLKVLPQIQSGKSKAEINSLIYDEIITPIHDQVGACKLSIDMSDILGMLYFLTGNCHLEWK